MASKSDDVHEKIKKLNRDIEKKRVEKDLATNLRQKEIKQKKIDEWSEEIVKLQSSIHGKEVLAEEGKEEQKKKKRKVYVEDPN